MMKNLSPRNSEVRSSIASIFSSIDQDAFERWTTLLWESSGIEPKVRKPFHEKIARQYDLILPDQPDAGSKLLFAIQTFFAGIVKHFVQNKIERLHLADPFFSWNRLEEQESFRRFSKSFSAIFCKETLDVFAKPYQQLYPAEARKALGEFYTPDWLAEFLVRKIDEPNEMILDPACGSGVFLLAAIDELLKRNISSKEILKRIRGFDLNPLAVLMARANIALKLEIKDETSIPVYLKDSILDEPDKEEYRTFNVVGNPPWLNWDRLPKDYRDKTKPLWERYGLFNLSGNEARYGGAKKELAQLMIYRVADQYLKQKGKLAVVLPFSMFQTRKSGDGFRRFQLPEGDFLNVLAVDDFSRMKPSLFSGVGTKPATLFFEKGTQTKYPVPLYVWSARNHSKEYEANLSDSNNHGSSWKIERKGTPRLHDPVDVLSEQRKNESDYRAYLGANTGGANGVFWLEILGPSKNSPNRIRIRNLSESGKLRLPEIETEVEKELVFPLLRWKDVDRFETQTPTCFILLTQNIETRTGISLDRMQKNYPAALNYLKRFETELRRRAAFRKYQFESPFYSMYNIGKQTVSPIKVVWRRMDKMIRAAVLEPMQHPLLGMKPIIPQETCVLIPCQSKDEADYLVELLNGNEVARLIESHCTAGSKGFGSPGIMDFLGIRRYKIYSQD